jgi:hypothetical protein
VFASCTTYKVIDILDTFKDKIQKGYAVRIIRKDRKELIFKVTDINRELIVDENNILLLMKL